MTQTDGAEHLISREGGQIVRYVCDLCGYVYDEEVGDIENGIDPDTEWEDLPEDYECPLCGAGKELFSEE